MRLVLYVPVERILFLLKSGRRKWIKFRKSEDKNLIQYLKLHPSGTNAVNMPAKIRNYLYNRKVKSVVPIIFRDSLLGFIGFATTLKPTQFELAEYFATRISLVLENDLLKEQIPRSLLIEKEFTLARRVEDFLTREDEIIYHGYSIKKIDSNWNKKYFPAIYSASLIQSAESFFEGLFTLLQDKKEKEKPLSLILFRLQKTGHRSKFIQLFIIKGYFLALSKNARSLNELTQLIQKTILEQENGRILLEGFILFFSPAKNIEINYFGRGLKVQVNNEWLNLEERESLGARNWKSRKVLKYKKPFKVILNIRGHSLLRLANSEAGNEIP